MYYCYSGIEENWVLKHCELQVFFFFVFFLKAKMCIITAINDSFPDVSDDLLTFSGIYCFAMISYQAYEHLTMTTSLQDIAGCLFDTAVPRHQPASCCARLMLASPPLPVSPSAHTISTKIRATAKVRKHI